MGSADLLLRGTLLVAHGPSCLLDAGIHAAHAAHVSCSLYPLTEVDPSVIGATSGGLLALHTSLPKFIPGSLSWVIGVGPLASNQSRMRAWSASHSVLCKPLVLNMVSGYFLLVRIRSSWCQCLDLGWRQETLCWTLFSLVLKECVGDGQLVEAAQLKESLTILVHLANTVLSEGGRLCIVVVIAGHAFYCPVKCIFSSTEEVSVGA